jgi:xanthosine utilization system XapX-like protein
MVADLFRSRTAPPMIALVGLLGMVLGQQVVDMAKRHFAPPPQNSVQHDASIQHDASGAQGPSRLGQPK